MVLKFLIFVALAVFVQGSVYEGDHIPIAYSHPYLGQPPYYSRVSYKPIVAPVTKTVVQPAVAHYDFGYALSNPYGDNHQSRVESRRGDIVAGSYSVLDADGTKRIVDYTATPQGGFKAVVRKEPGVLPLAGKHRGGSTINRSVTPMSLKCYQKIPYSSQELRGGSTTTRSITRLSHRHRTQQSKPAEQGP
ncbi:cuticle protein 8-like [Aethina tumida]|uniref:cuticle protein 8-like n=1 Tax=Aethina tumida TaxID=116153 RepID=UPI002149637C|nr:cuticle protein 8-like [Aethina tumida]